MNPNRPKSQNTRPQLMGRVFYLKTTLSAVPEYVRSLFEKDASTLTKEEINQIRPYQKSVDFYYDMVERQGKNWDGKAGKKELARAAKRLANTQKETV